MTQINKSLLNAEKNLNLAASVPFLGAIPAALRVVISSVITAVSAIFLIILSLPALCSEKAKEGLETAGHYFIHGFVGIFSAAFRAIPGVGTCMVVGNCCNEALKGAREGVKQAIPLANSSLNANASAGPMVASLAVASGASMGAVLGGLNAF